MAGSWDDYERFWSKVDRSGECWMWRGYANVYGYGRVSLKGKQRFAHRVSYEWLVGEIPTGLEIDHLCRTTLCVNPAHMEPVTHAENVRRGENYWKRQTHCVHGHPFSGDNLYKYKGKRKCRTCMRAAWKRFRQKQRAS